MKKFLATLIAGSFVSGVFATETVAPVASDVVVASPVKDASAPKAKKHHYAKKKHHAMKKAVASEVK